MVCLINKKKTKINRLQLKLVPIDDYTVGTILIFLFFLFWQFYFFFPQSYPIL